LGNQGGFLTNAAQIGSIEMTHGDLLAIADLLYEAEISSTACRPVRNLLDGDDIDSAYAVQSLNVDRALAAGRRISGRKIGLTSEAVQTQLGVDRPDFGVLFTDMCFADGLEVPIGHMISPRAEAEVALVLSDDLSDGPFSVVDIINATAYALPAIEIVDSRVANWDITILDTVADNASCGAYVVGTRPVSLGQLNLLDAKMSMTLDAAVASTGSGAACLGNPLNAAVWLADTVDKLGSPLRAGECIMTGALGPMFPISPGHSVSAQIDGLDSVSARFVA